MPRRDNFYDQLVESLAIPENKTATVTSSTCDLQDYNMVSFFVHFGDSADTLSGSVYWTCKLQDSDDDSTYADVAAANLIGSDDVGWAVVNAPTDDSRILGVGYSGIKRYVQVVVTATGSHSSGTPISIIAKKSPVVMSTGQETAAP